MTKRVTATINIGALINNCNEIQSLAEHSNILAMVKADAYGHGACDVAKALEPVVAGFGVATLEEAEALRRSGVESSIVLLEGFNFPHELAIAKELKLDVVVHQMKQLELLLETSCTDIPRIWLKLDTGMHRLGFSLLEWPTVFEKLEQSDFSQPIVVMSHLACADEPNHPQNKNQIRSFLASVEHLPFPKSLANSAAILSDSNLHFDWVRPGIMLYGVSPFDSKPLSPLFTPVMSLTASVIALRDLPAGETIGYGANYQCDKPRRIATVSIGYGDGYPRAAETGTPCMINGVRCSLVGRVSMDMVTVDVSDLDCVELGDQVELWGRNVRIEEVAKHCNMIAYELLTGLTGRVSYQYVRHSVRE